MEDQMNIGFNEKALSKEEMLDSITKDELSQKTHHILASKIEDVSIVSQTKMDNLEDEDFVWGIKQNANNYKTVKINDEVYALNDCVRCRSGLQLDYIGKIMKLSEENGLKVCTLRWFFRPSELPISIKGMDYTPDARELFLAFGEGIGVENKNLLVSCYDISNVRNINNVENVVSLGVIINKCKILCIAEDDFNDLPSSEHLNACEFYFSKAFNCDTSEIIGLDSVVDAIGAQKVYNKKEWLSNKIDKHSTSMVSSPKRTLCQSFGSYTLPMNPNSTNALPLLHCNSPPSITEQSTKRKIIEKRKRSTIKEEIISPKKIEKLKKIKLSPASKNSKLPITNITNVTSSKQEVCTLESITESKNAILAVDVVQTLITNKLILSKENHGPSSFKELLNMAKNDKMNGKIESPIDLLTIAPMILEHTIERVENNADDIHVTCEGFPMQNLLEPLERSESSTSKLKKDENNLALVISRNGIGEPNEPSTLKKTKEICSKEQKVASKTTRNRRGKNSSNIVSNTTLKKPTTRKSQKSGIGSRAQNKNKKIKDTEIGSETLAITRFHNSQKSGKNSIANEQQSLKSLSIISQSTTIGETLKDVNLLNVEPVEGFPTTKQIVEDASPHILDVHPIQMFESKCEEIWEKEIDKAIAAKRIILLNNVDPELHSIDLEEALSKILKTKCEVRKTMPISCFYDTTSALLKLMTSSIAEEVLQNLCENCLVIRGRTVIASLYENQELVTEILKFSGHINFQPKYELSNNDCKEISIMSHVAQGGTIEFTFGLRWRLLQEQHELQWQLLKELHDNEVDILNKETTKQTRSKKSR